MKIYLSELEHLRKVVKICVKKPYIKKLVLAYGPTKIRTAWRAMTVQKKYFTFNCLLKLKKNDEKIMQTPSSEPSQKINYYKTRQLFKKYDSSHTALFKYRVGSIEQAIAITSYYCFFPIMFFAINLFLTFLLKYTAI